MRYPASARERAMKREEVILRLWSKQLTFCAAGCSSLPPASSTKWGSSTETVLRALRAVVEQRGIFCSLYSDRASHFWLTPKAGELRQSGTSTAGAGHPHDSGVFAQARGRSERNVGTWQRRLPQELRLRGISTREEANRFLGKLRRGVQPEVCGGGSSQRARFCRSAGRIWSGFSRCSTSAWSTATTPCSSAIACCRSSGCTGAERWPAAAWLSASISRGA